jgi:UDP-glucose 4-epimerase
MSSEAVRALSGARVVVTGGLGFIGSRLARSLAGGGADVVVIDALVPGLGGTQENLEMLSKHVDVRIGDLRDSALVEQALDGCDVVFNLAAQTGHVASMRAPRDDLGLNCDAQLSLLEAVRRRCAGARVVFTSTRQVYGRAAALPVSEEHPVSPVDVNGIHKLAVERYHLLYREAYGLDTSILRLTNVYGPGMRTADGRQCFLGLWVGRVVRGEPIELFRPGSQRRDLVYVDDVVEALSRAARAPAAGGEVINIGSPTSISLHELAELLVSVAGGGAVALVDFPDERALIDIGDFATDAAKAQRLLGWQPRVGLEVGLAASVAFERAALGVPVGSVT